MALDARTKSMGVQQHDDNGEGSVMAFGQPFMEGAAHNTISFFVVTWIHVTRSWEKDEKMRSHAQHT